MNRSQTNTITARNVRADAFVAQMDQIDRAAVVRAIEQRDMAELERAAIAARIKQAREEAGLSQPEMAEAIGVIPRTYQNYESLTKPRTPWGLMGQIATVTGKPTEWLIHGDRPTPDLLGIASSHQVGDIRAEFREDVDELKESLDTVEQRLAEAAQERQDLRDQIAEQNSLLARQSELLEKIESLVAILKGAEIIEQAAEPVRELPLVHGPEPAHPAPAQTPQRDTGTSGHVDRRVRDRRRNAS